MDKEPSEIKNMLENKSKHMNVVETKVAVASYREIWHDIINFRGHFNKKDFSIGLISGLGNNKGSMVRSF